jgi:hypothetical protein
MTVSEKELAAVAVAPRVTAQDVDEAIARESYTRLSGSTTTVCELTLQNGFTVLGESACADPANFNQELGERLSHGQAKNKIWAFLGYELKTKLNLIQKAGQPSGAILSLGSPVTYVGTKVVHALLMTRGEYNVLRGWQLPADENGEDLGYLVQYVDGGAPNVHGFTGYISWSPRDVFEKSYDCGVRQKPETFLDRLKVERAQLAERLTKLNAFLETEQAQNLEDYNVLQDQGWAMQSYLNALDKRLGRLV